MDDTEHYVDKLHAVFDLCDINGQGFISVEHFVSLAREHFGADGGQEINDIIKVLDRSGDGRIYFNEFCQGVQQILELRAPVSPYPSDTEVTLQTIGSEETLVAIDDDSNSCGTHETSELSTYNEYDMMTDDDQGMVAQNDLLSSPIENIPHLNLPRPLICSEDDGDSAISGKSSEFQDHRREQEVTDEEERFEDFGEAEELESESDTQATAVDGTRHGALSGSSRKVTSSALASQLFRATGSSAGTSRRSSCSDEIFDDIDGNFMELNDKVKHLEAQIHMLTDSQMKNDERHMKIKDENSFLVERIHILEEQLRDVEVKSQERLQEEQRQHREVMSRSDKDKSREIEILTNSLQHIEREYQSLKEEAPRLRAEVDRLRRENTRLEDKVNELQYNLSGLSDDHQELQERAQQQRQDMEQEREVNAQLLDELSKELEELRNFKLERDGRSRTPSLSNGEPPSRRRELEAQVIRLKEENIRLREHNDDLHAQLLNNHLEEGRNLLQNGISLASEIETLPRDELMKAVRDQQEVNAKLREYVDRLMLRIMEQNPSLLEVTEQMPARGKGKKK